MQNTYFGGNCERNTLPNNGDSSVEIYHNIVLCS